MSQTFDDCDFLQLFRTRSKLISHVRSYYANFFYFQSTFTLEDGKLIQTQKKIKDGDHDSHFVRYVDGDKLIMEMECEGVKAKRVYLRA